jgi:adenylosuccinate lyase
MSRKDAYEIVQRNSMRSWREGEDFFELLRKDQNVRSIISEGELSELFDYQYYLRHIDVGFERLGLDVSK